MQERSKKLKNFILKNSYLFWSIPEDSKINVSDELLLEYILNYSEMPTIKEYLDIVGINQAKMIFNNLSDRRKKNIFPEIYNLFMEYFTKNA